MLHQHWPELYGVSALNPKNILSSYWKEDYGYFDQTFPVSGVMERLVPEFLNFMTEFRSQVQKPVYGKVRIPQ